LGTRRDGRGSPRERIAPCEVASSVRDERSLAQERRIEAQLLVVCHEAHHARGRQLIQCSAQRAKKAVERRGDGLLGFVEPLLLANPTSRPIISVTCRTIRRM
jgi:hypothetical protein